MGGVEAPRAGHARRGVDGQCVEGKDRLSQRRGLGRVEEGAGLALDDGLERSAGAWDSIVYSTDDLYPDALECLERLRAAGLVVGVAGNQTAALEAWARSSELPVDVVTGSASLGVRKPDREFFERLVDLVGAPASEVAYVGDRADNDAGPALAAGLVSVHLRRGPWGMLQPTPAGAVAIESLAELPGALA